MYLSRVFDPAARAYRVRYAIARILRNRLRNEGTFRNCFEMEDGDEVVLAILRCGLKDPKLRRALEWQLQLCSEVSDEVEQLVEAQRIHGLPDSGLSAFLWTLRLHLW